jgi:small-conductance mechanosensitive channel
MIALAASGKATEPMLRMGEQFVQRGFEVLLLVAALVIAHQVLFLLIRRVNKVVVKNAGHDAPDVKKRADTVASVLKNVASVAVLGLGIVLVMEVMGVDVAPFLAGAGILGVALGFGAQSLVRDVLSGVFILSEHQISVGDTVMVAGVTGTVEQVRVRSLRLRDLEGRVHYIPNGEIRMVANLSQGAARFVVDIPVPADKDPAEALSIVRAAVQAFGAQPAQRALLLDPPETLGYEALGAGQNTIRVVARALRQDGQIVRELRYAVIVALAARGIQAGATAAATTSPPAVLTGSAAISGGASQ